MKAIFEMGCKDAFFDLKKNIKSLLQLLGAENIATELPLD
jgi:hypothetical protein